MPRESLLPAVLSFLAAGTDVAHAELLLRRAAPGDLQRAEALVTSPAGAAAIGAHRRVVTAPSSLRIMLVGR